LVTIAALALAAALERLAKAIGPKTPSSAASPRFL